MLRKMHLIAALAMGAISCSSYGQETQPDFGVWLQQIARSSAVSPIGSGTPAAPKKAINILKGNFDQANRVDAIFITDEGTKYCKGPHFKKCDEITALPLRTTVAVNGDKGRDILFRWDGASSFQTCSLDWSRGNASVDCRNLAYADLSKYGRVQANGAVLMIDGTDGQYLCQAISKSAPSCHLVAVDKNGTAPEKRKRGEAAKFRPNKDEVCHFNGDAFDCKRAVKVGEVEDMERTVAQTMQPFMRPVLLFEDEQDEMPTIELPGVEIIGSYDGGGSWGMWGGNPGNWQGWIHNYTPEPAWAQTRFHTCMNGCKAGYDGSLTTCLSSFPVGFALGAALCGVGCGDALGSLMVSTCMLGREIEHGNCRQGCINNYGT
jgi:hypothetical protein